MKKFPIIVFSILIIVSLGFLVRYINYHNSFITSNAGFIKSDSITYLSFKVDGKINYLALKSGDKIKKNELVASLETNELNTTLNKIKFDILSLQNRIEEQNITKQKLLNDINLNSELIQTQIKILDKNIESSKENINAMQVEVKKSKDDLKRYSFLYKTKKISIDKYETIKTKSESMKFKLLSLQKKLNAMELSKNSLNLKLKLIQNQKYDVEKISKNITSLLNSKKSLFYQAKLILQKIDDSFIYAPFSGVVAKKYVNIYQVIKKGQNIITIVNPKDLYVSLLLEETKLKDLKIGDTATIHIDALDKNFKAKVTKILPASASTFAIIPRDLSSGEFTKLAQRFVVKLKILNPDERLRIGMSCEVTIKKSK